MSLAERIARYRQLAGEQGNAAIKYKNQLNANSLFRLLLFLTGSLFCYFLYPATVPVLVVAAATTIGFLALLKRHGELQQRMARSEVLAKIAKNELRAFEHDFTPFDGAAEHVDPSHPFSFDLDIFGEGSLFQMLNRTSLERGKGELASMLKMPLREGGEIRKRQGAVRELSKRDFCLTSDYDVVRGAQIESRPANWPGREQQLFRRPSLWRAITHIVPLLYLLTIALVLAGATGGQAITLLYFITLSISVIPTKSVKRIGLLFDKRAKQLESYAGLLKLVESTSFDSELLQTLQQSLQNDKKMASTSRKLLPQILTCFCPCRSS